MADYNYQQNKFGSKDGLTTGNALKEIVGSEFEIEFLAIDSAIKDKLAAATGTFSGTLTGPAIITTISGGTF